MLAVLPLLAVGCASHSGAITEAPADWSSLEGDTITVQGTAGNSPRGPIVRLIDGGYVALKQREPWGFADGYALASRSVEVAGKLVSGAGIRDERFVLDVTRVRLMAADEIKRKTPDPAATP